MKGHVGMCPTACLGQGWTRYKWDRTLRDGEVGKRAMADLRDPAIRVSTPMGDLALHRRWFDISS